MNERIRELAIEAGAKVIGDQFRYMKMYEDDIEKFAELIIKETLQVARAGIEYGPSMEEAVYTYFGVTE